MLADTYFNIFDLLSSLRGKNGLVLSFLSRDFFYSRGFWSSMFIDVPVKDPNIVGLRVRDACFRLIVY